MSKKLLNDVASILAELGVSYQTADDIAIALNPFFETYQESQDWIDLASNAPSAGECGC